VDLLIVESNAKAKTIQKYLGKQAAVGACMGHVQDLPTSGKEGRKAMWASRGDALPNPPWEWTEKAQSVINNLLKIARDKKVERVLVGTDPDREGEFIAWRLAEIFGEIAPVVRVRFHEITPDAIQEAIDAAGVVDEGLVDAAKVRRFMDRLIGYRTSRFSRSWGLRSMGRVQTPTLGFVVERENEINAFVPIKYWSADIVAKTIDFNVRFHEKDDEAAWRDGKGRINLHRTGLEPLALNAFKALQAAGDVEITKVTDSTSKRKAPLPFTTDTLLAEAGSRFRWRPALTMRTAQGLYEQGHITYMRTDSTRTNPAARATVQQTIEKLWDASYVATAPPAPKKGKKDDKGVQDAHEAIRPTRPNLRKLNLEGNQAKLYALIWSRFAASQMAPAKWARQKVNGAVVGLDLPLDANLSWRLHPGWEAAFDQFGTAPASAPPIADLAAGQKLSVDKAEDNPTLVVDQTKPPSRFTQHGLVAQMKKSGIGRPSTYAATIQKLLERKYMHDESGTVHPSEQGTTLWMEVAPFYKSGEESGLFSTDFTARMEDTLDGIENGATHAAPSWDAFVKAFRELHINAQTEKKKSATPRQMAYYERLAAVTEPVKLGELLGGKTPEELTGEEMGDLLTQLREAAGDGALGATEKQIGYITKLTERLKLTEAAACAVVEVASFADLSGGRGGSASDLISKLQAKADELPTPPSEKQLRLISRLAKQLELEEPAAAALVEAKDFAALTGRREGTASQLINALKERAAAAKKKKKEAAEAEAADKAPADKA
jgi:DNA topoisomerase I